MRPKSCVRSFQSWFFQKHNGTVQKRSINCNFTSFQFQNIRVQKLYVSQFLEPSCASENSFCNFGGVTLYPQQKKRVNRFIALSTIEATLNLLSSIVVAYPMKPNRRVIGYVIGRCLLMAVLKVQPLESKFECLRLLFRQQGHAMIGIAWVLKLVLIQGYRWAFEMCRR